MRSRKEFLYSLVLMAILVLNSCASTTLTSVWKDETYRSGNIKKVLIIAFSERPAVRRFFEDEFKRQMTPLGVEAISSYTVVPYEKLSDKEFLAAQARNLRLDAVLITRLVDKKTVQSYFPPETAYMGPSGYSTGWPTYCYNCYQALTRPGYTVENEIVSLETNLYEARTDTLIWSALSDTFAESDKDDYIRSFISVIMKKLSDDKIL
ncbi:MAG TPA: hypothetical protein VEI46_02085 [Thermodesulfovibrionales bacterium]|nr:hypothetical protein [Thermodesulfovibrionales bacterium]